MDALFGLTFLLGLFAAYVDIRTKLIPNRLIVVSISLLLILCLVIDRSSLAFRLLFATSVFLLLMSLNLLSKNKFGMGDVKLISIIAFSYLPIGSWIVLIVACVTGIVFALLHNVFHKRKYFIIKGIPFAPFLCIGMAIALFAKDLKLW